MSTRFDTDSTAGTQPLSLRLEPSKVGCDMLRWYEQYVQQSAASMMGPTNPYEMNLGVIAIHNWERPIIDGNHV